MLTFDHLVLVAADVERTLRFYESVCRATVKDFEQWRRGDAPYPVLHFGSFKVNVHPAGSGITPGAERAEPGTLDICLSWPGSAESAARHLEDHGVELVFGPIAQEGAAGEGTSVYFRDPDLNLVEFIAYPS